MTNSEHDISGGPTVTTEPDLTALWRGLVDDEDFVSRTLWLVLLDAAGRRLPVVVPIEDIPQTPEAASVEAFSTVLAHLAGFGSPVLLISRPGAGAVEQDDVHWAQALAPLAPRCPVHLATEDGDAGVVVRPIRV